MKFTSTQYTFRVIFESDEGGYHAYVPALSGCHTWGKNLEEVRENVREAIKSHVGCPVMYLKRRIRLINLV